MILNINRKELISLLPTNKVCAEIGVATGKFSFHILKSNRPKKLYLIDSWENFDLGYNDSNMVLNDEHEQRYLMVREKIKKFNNVEIIRKRSCDAFEIFPDNYFDWIYIDGDHSFSGCYNDLKLAALKVKSEGFICGHDYLADGFFREGFGVNEAVNLFVKEKKLELLLTNEKDYKSYIIGKKLTNFELNKK
jgi:hypothetical protein